MFVQMKCGTNKSWQIVARVRIEIRACFFQSWINVWKSQYRLSFHEYHRANCTCWYSGLPCNWWLIDVSWFTTQKRCSYFSLNRFDPSASDSALLTIVRLYELSRCALTHCVCVCVGVKKSELELVRYNELKAKKSLLEEHLQIKLEQLYNLCLQEAVSIRSSPYSVAFSGCITQS